MSTHETYIVGVYTVYIDNYIYMYFKFIHIHICIYQFDKSAHDISTFLPFTYGHGPFVTERASSHSQGGGPPDLGVELEKI